MDNSARNVISIIDRETYDRRSQGSERSGSRELPALIIDAEFYEVSRRAVTLASLARDFAYGLMMATGGLAVICGSILVAQYLGQ